MSEREGGEKGKGRERERERERERIKLKANDEFRAWPPHNLEVNLTLQF